MRTPFYKIPGMWFYNLKNGIRNLVSWVPVIWGDHDFDYHYLLRIMHHKISMMEKFFNSDDTHILDADEVAKDLKVCRILLKRIIDDEYILNATEPLDKKWGDLKIWSEPTDNPNFTSVEVGRPHLSEKNQVIAKKAQRRANEHSENMKQQDLEFFVKIFRKKLFGWWD